MGNNSSHTSKKQTSSLIVTRMIDPNTQRTASLSSIPLSLGAASLSCLAAEHHQIHDQEMLDTWKAKALHTIDDLYEQKAAKLRHEAHMSALLGQLRAIIDEEMPRHGHGYMIDDQHLQNMHAATPNNFKE